MTEPARFAPAPPEVTLPEITLRGVLLGVAMTFLFTAANLYLGLKVGLTFATSIPAAVISMALLRAFRTSNILENNIVQTIASAAGTLASIGFVLPGLIMIGWWAGFAFWTTFWVCAAGGLLGVLFSVPLRRALVTGSDLPYPEGVAAAAVLHVGSETREGAAESRIGLRTILAGSLAAAGYSLVAATQTRHRRGQPLVPRRAVRQRRGLQHAAGADRRGAPRRPRGRHRDPRRADHRLRHRHADPCLAFARSRGRGGMGEAGALLRRRRDRRRGLVDARNARRPDRQGAGQFARRLGRAQGRRHAAAAARARSADRPARPRPARSRAARRNPHLALRRRRPARAVSRYG